MSKFVNSTGHTVSWTQHFSLPAIVAQSAFSSAAWMMGSEGQSQPVTSYTSSAHHCNNICFSIICSALPFHKPFHLRVTSIAGTVCPAPWAAPAATHIQVQGRNILHGKISLTGVSSVDGVGVGVGEVSHQNHLKSILSHNIVCTVHQLSLPQEFEDHKEAEAWSAAAAVNIQHKLSFCWFQSQLWQRTVPTLHWRLCKGSV